MLKAELQETNRIAAGYKNWERKRIPTHFGHLEITKLPAMEAGEEPKVPVLFLGGFGTTPEVNRFIGAALAKEGYDVTLAKYYSNPLRRLPSLSARKLQERANEDLLDEAVALANMLQTSAVREVNLVTHSRGTVVGLTLLEILAARQAKDSTPTPAIKKAAFMAPAGMRDTDNVFRLAYGFFHDIVEEFVQGHGSWERRSHPLVTDRLFNTLGPEIASVVQNIPSHIRQAEQLGRIPSEQRQQYITDLLERTGTSVLILYGGNDKVFPSGYRGNIKNSRISEVTIPGNTHFSPVGHPEAYMDYIKTFFDDTTPESSLRR